MAHQDRENLYLLGLQNKSNTTNSMDIKSIVNDTPGTSGSSNTGGNANPGARASQNVNNNSKPNSPNQAVESTSQYKPPFKLIAGMYLVEDPQNTAIRGFINPVTGQRYSFYDPVFINSIHAALEHQACAHPSALTYLQLDKFDTYTRNFLTDYLRDIHKVRLYTPDVYNTSNFRKNFLTLKD